MPRSEISSDLTSTIEDYLQSIYSLETEGYLVIVMGAYLAWPSGTAKPAQQPERPATFTITVEH